MDDPDPESRDLLISFKKPLNLELLKPADTKELKLKKTEIKRLEKEQKRLEKQLHKQGSSSAVAIWEDGENGEQWWHYGKKMCMNDIITDYKYPLQKMLSED